MIQKSRRNKTYKALLGFCKIIPLIPMFVYKMSLALCLDFNFLLTFILLSHNVIAFKSVEISERNICINLFSGKWKFHVFDLNVIFVSYDYYSRSYDRAKNSLHICKSVYIVT